jgi:hypothetical protein
MRGPKGSCPPFFGGAWDSRQFWPIRRGGTETQTREDLNNNSFSFFGARVQPSSCVVQSLLLASSPSSSCLLTDWPLPFPRDGTQGQRWDQPRSPFISEPTTPCLVPPNQRACDDMRQPVGGSDAFSDPIDQSSPPRRHCAHPPNHAAAAAPFRPGRLLTRLRSM